MDIGLSIRTTEALSLIGIFQYYRDMWHRLSLILVPLTNASGGPEVIKILWNDSLEDTFKELKRMVSSENSY